MRRKSPYHILLLPLLLCMMTVASCGSRSVMRELESMESVLDDSPDSVRSRLDRIDASSLHGESRALYAMLRTQADYKCYVDIPGDSLIREATSYYGIRRRNWRAAMSWYSLGCVNDENNVESAALDAYLKSCSLFPDTTSKYYALSLQNMADIFLNTGMYDEAERAIQSCLSHPACAKYGKMYYHVLYNLGKIALFRREYTKAESIITSLLSDTLVSDFYRTDALLQLTKIQLYGKDNPQEAVNLCDDLIAALDGKRSIGAAFSLKGDSYYMLHQFDSAYVYYTESLDCTEDIYTICSSSRRLSELCMVRGDYEGAQFYAEQYDCLHDSIFNERWIIELDKVRQEHASELASSILHANHQRFVITMVGLILILALLLLLLFERRKKAATELIIAKQQDLLQKQKNLMRQEEQLHRSTINELQIRVRSLSENDEAARPVLLDLYSRKLVACRKVFESTSSGTALANIRISQSESSCCSLTKKDKTVMIDGLLDTYKDVIQDIFVEIPTINNDDVITILLSSLGCSNNLTAVIMNVTTAAIQKRKYRLLHSEKSDFIKLFMPQ